MKSHFVAAAAALAAMLAATTAARAQSDAAGNYVQVNLGSGLGGNANLSGSASGLGSAQTNVNVTPGFFGSAAVGHSFRYSFAFEGEGYYARNNGDTKSLVGVGSTVESYGALANLMYAIGRLGPAVPYIGAGVGYGHVGYSAAGESINDAGFIWQVRAGFSGNINPAMKWDVGYRYLAEPTYRISGSLSTDVGPITGKAEIDTRLNVLTFGIRQRF